MTGPRPTPRVSEERLARLMQLWVMDENPDNPCHGGCALDASDLALDLRDSRAEVARWQEVAEELAGALDELTMSRECLCSAAALQGEEQMCAVCKALARFEAAKKEHP